MSRYAIAYDVTEDRVRERVRSVCRKYGARRQYSLYEVQLSPTDRARMVEELRSVVSSADDGKVRVRIYSVGPQSNDIDIPEQNHDDNKPENIV